MDPSFDGSNYIDEGELYAGPSGFFNPRSGLPHRGLMFTPDGGIRSHRTTRAHSTSIGDELQIPPLGAAWRFGAEHFAPGERDEFNRIVLTRSPHTPVTQHCPLSADVPAIYLPDLPALRGRIAATGSQTDPVSNEITLNRDNAEDVRRQTPSGGTGNAQSGGGGATTKFWGIPFGGWEKMKNLGGPDYVGGTSYILIKSKCM